MRKHILLKSCFFIRIRVTIFWFLGVLHCPPGGKFTLRRIFGSPILHYWIDRPLQRPPCLPPPRSGHPLTNPSFLGGGGKISFLFHFIRILTPDSRPPQIPSSSFLYPGQNFRTRAPNFRTKNGHLVNILEVQKPKMPPRFSLCFFPFLNIRVGLWPHCLGDSSII